MILVGIWLPCFFIITIYYSGQKFVDKVWNEHFQKSRISIEWCSHEEIYLSFCVYFMFYWWFLNIWNDLIYSIVHVQEECNPICHIFHLKGIIQQPSCLIIMEMDHVFSQVNEATEVVSELSLKLGNCKIRSQVKLHMTKIMQNNIWKFSMNLAWNSFYFIAWQILFVVWSSSKSPGAHVTYKYWKSLQHPIQLSSDGEHSQIKLYGIWIFWFSNIKHFCN